MGSVVFNVTWIWPIRLRFYECRVVVARHLEVWLLVSNWPLCLDSGQHTNIISRNPDIGLEMQMFPSSSIQGLKKRPAYLTTH